MSSTFAGSCLGWIWHKSRKNEEYGWGQRLVGICHRYLGYLTKATPESSKIMVSCIKVLKKNPICSSTQDHPSRHQTSLNIHDRASAQNPKPRNTEAHFFGDLRAWAGMGSLRGSTSGGLRRKKQIPLSSFKTKGLGFRGFGFRV